LATSTAKRREQRLQSLLLDRLSFKYQRLIAKEIARTMVQTNLSNPLSIEEAEFAHKERIDKLLNRLWFESADQMIQQTFGQKQKALLASFQPTVGTNSIMRDFVRSFGLQKIVQISSTTIKQLRDVINQSIADGLSERETSKLIQERAPTIAASRATNNCT